MIRSLLIVPIPIWSLNVVNATVDGHLKGFKLRTDLN